MVCSSRLTLPRIVYLSLQNCSCGRIDGRRPEAPFGELLPHNFQTIFIRSGPVRRSPLIAMGPRVEPLLKNLPLHSYVWGRLLAWWANDYLKSAKLRLASLCSTANFTRIVILRAQPLISHRYTGDLNPWCSGVPLFNHWLRTDMLH